MGSIPELERSPGAGNGNPLQYSCLGNLMDNGSWQATVHGAARVRHDLANKQQHLSPAPSLLSPLSPSSVWPTMPWSVPELSTPTPCRSSLARRACGCGPHTSRRTTAPGMWQACHPALRWGLLSPWVGESLVGGQASATRVDSPVAVGPFSQAIFLASSAIAFLLLYSWGAKALKGPSACSELGALGS